MHVTCIEQCSVYLTLTTESCTLMAGIGSWPSLDNWYSLHIHTVIENASVNIKSSPPPPHSPVYPRHALLHNAADILGSSRELPQQPVCGVSPVVQDHVVLPAGRLLQTLVNAPPEVLLRLATPRKDGQVWRGCKHNGYYTEKVHYLQCI